MSPSSIPAANDASFWSEHRSSTPSTAGEALVFVVDDTLELTELYKVILEGAGYAARSFNDREKALAALRAEPRKPDLLITDFVGPSLPVEEFLQACRILHPDLRILMASGLHKIDAPLSRLWPDRFIQKPFTSREFLEAVRAALTA